MTKKKLYSLLCTVTLLSSPLVSLVPSVQAEASVNVTNQQTTEKANKAITKKQAVNNNYQTAISSGAMYIMMSVLNDPSTGGAWEALALSRYGTSTVNQLKDQLDTVIGNDIDNMVSAKHFSGTDLERSIIGLAALGEDPTDFHKLNLIDQVIKQIKADEASYAEHGYKIGSNEVIYGIIALSTGNYGTKIDATINDLIKQLLQNQNSDGGWDLNNQGTNDVDITGMALTALGMHQDQAGVQTAITKAVQMLKTKVSFQVQVVSLFQVVLLKKKILVVLQW